MQSPFINLRLPGPFARRRGRGAAFDPVAAYIAAVEAADGQTLEEGVKQAIDGFVTGCKADGIWDAIKASCILAGARTLNGALVPLAGDAPTNFNFVSEDYDRVAGLKGDGSTKLLDSNRSNAADPQDSQHLSVFVTENASGVTGYIGSNRNNEGTSQIAVNEPKTIARSRHLTTGTQSVDRFSTGLNAISRSNSSNFNIRVEKITSLAPTSSRSPQNDPITVFDRGENNITDARLSFYSIGEDIDLAALDTRVTTLMAEIEAALT